VLRLAQIYHPITAAPFRNDEAYREIAPCRALRPYIRCFWGTDRPMIREVHHPADNLVIPDTCMDLIFNVNYTRNSSHGHFCVVDEKSFRSASEFTGDVCSTFAIRFYAWSAILFCDGDFRRGDDLTAEEFSQRLKAELEPILFDVPTLREKIGMAEVFLLRRLDENRLSADLLNSIYMMIESGGRAKVSEICARTAVSERRMERLFRQNIGVTPKSFSSLIRYQLLWQDMILSRSFNVLDAVDKFGYTDQPHLLRDFRRRHLMTPREALSLALSDFYNTAPAECAMMDKKGKKA